MFTSGGAVILNILVPLKPVQKKKNLTSLNSRRTIPDTSLTTLLAYKMVTSLGTVNEFNVSGMYVVVVCRMREQKRSQN